nr:PemK family transcriptional regulator [Thiocapsa sp. KS1]
MIAGDRPGAVLADQVKSLDWVARKAQHKGRVFTAELHEVRAKVLALLGSELQQ